MTPYRLLLLLQAITFTAFGQIEGLKLKHIGTEAGLSQTNVTSILQDSRGFMWFGTRDGLNKYDGYNFTVYRNDPAKPLSLCNDHILALTEDGNKTMWVGTNGGGLDTFNRQKNNFKHFRYHKGDANGVSNDYINFLL